MQKERESSFELLRLLCIAGIIFMHTFGPLNDSLSSANREISVFINALFNTGVTCFILISGYFGIRFDLAKLIRLDLVIIFYTLLGTLLTGEITAQTLIFSFFPILTERYWFLSCYFALCLLSLFLNQLVEKADKNTLRNIILVLLLLCSVIPTFFFYELIPDSGKGIVQMVMIYLLGRYLRKYHTEHLRKSRLFLLLGVSTLLIFAADSILTRIKGVQMDTFCRDNSLFIIFSSVMLLLLFREFHFSSRFINHLAGNVMPLYVFESFVRLYILNRFIDLGAYTDSPALIAYVIGYVLLTIIICMAINEVRRLTFVHLDNLIAHLLMKLYAAVAPALQKFWNRGCEAAVRYFK
jgi:surface polysaccharide O-acyltransferase-like enzyme